MGLESTTTISGLVASNPIGAADPKSQGDDHIRLIKTVLKTTFPNFTGVLNASDDQIDSIAFTHTLVDTAADNNAGPTLTLDRQSPSPAVADALGRIRFRGKDDAGNAVDYASIYADILDPTDGSEDGRLLFNVLVNTSGVTRLIMDSTGSVFTGDLRATGGGSLTGTWSNLGSVTTIDINGGTIDGATIGGSTTGVGTFSNNSGIKSGNVGAGIGIFRFLDSAGNRQGYVGMASTGNAHISLIADSGNDITINALGGANTINLVADGGINMSDTVAFGSNGPIDPTVAEFGASITPGGVTNIAASGANPLTVKRNADGILANFYSGTTAGGNISQAGSTTAYNTTSDRRMKKNFKEFDPGETIDALKFYEFLWKADDKKGFGVIAQEANEIFPQAVSPGATDDEMWGVDNRFFVPLAMRELQLLRKRVNKLETEKEEKKEKEKKNVPQGN